jgi:hypothetical protein
LLPADVEGWFTTYLADYAAMVRGDLDDRRRLLGHYSAPLLLSTDASCVTLADEEQVAAAVQRQVDDLRAAGYDRSEQVTAATVVLNRRCATHRVLLSRLRRDGSEIARLEATYLITEAGAGRRIAAIVVHSAP